jgi:hypothetical protein
VNGRPLIQTNLSDLYEQVGYNIDFTFRGQPQYYWREFDPVDPSAQLLKFWPACDSAMIALVSATILPAPIPPVGASSVVALNQIPTVYHPDILKYIIMRGQQKEKDFRASELYERQYNEGTNFRYDNAHEVAETFDTISPDPMDYGYTIAYE